MTLPGRSEWRWPIATHDAVAAAVGLPPLRTNVLPAQTREVRISWGEGMVWQPMPLLRLVEDGGQADGEFIRYWFRRNDSMGNLMPAPGWFTEDSTGRGICDIPREARPWIACRMTLLEPQPVWRGVADTLAALGLWDLPGKGVTVREPAQYWTDQTSVRIELREGGKYRFYSYYAPDRLRGTDAKTVAALLAYLDGLARLAGFH